MNEELEYSLIRGENILEKYFGFKLFILRDSQRYCLKVYSEESSSCSFTEIVTFVIVHNNLQWCRFYSGLADGYILL